MKRLLLTAMLVVFALPAYALDAYYDDGDLSNVPLMHQDAYIASSGNTADCWSPVYDGTNDDMDRIDCRDSVNMGGTAIEYGTALKGNPLGARVTQTFTSAQATGEDVILASSAGKSICIHDIKAYGTALATGAGTDQIVIEEETTNNDVITINVGAFTANTVIGPYTSGVTFGSAALDCLATGSGLMISRNGTTAAGEGSYIINLEYSVDE